MRYFLTLGLTLLLMSFSNGVFSQSTCCKKDKENCAKTEACCSSASVDKKTSGCTPSNCRGAKTKFGEAKVITNLRKSLIALKADLEKSQEPSFDKRSYDIHGIIGETDEESLEIIVAEVQLIENDFVVKLDYISKEFVLPSNKAKQVEYLNNRIEMLQSAL